jgi:hypothetical protein
MNELLHALRSHTPFDSGKEESKMGEVLVRPSVWMFHLQTAWHIYIKFDTACLYTKPNNEFHVGSYLAIQNLR